VPQPFPALTIRAAVVASTAAAALVTALPAVATAAAPTTTARTTTTALAAPTLPRPAPAAPAAASLIEGSGSLLEGSLLPKALSPAPMAPETAQVPVLPFVQAAPLAAPAVGTPTLAASPTLAGSSAMSRALSKVGSPYRWGATGPNAFDCSGLVSWAYKSSGVSLPRTSQAMSRVGRPVPRADLRPGDLVFFYRPVSHVGIYIGDGKIVHASSRKYPVKISDMGRMKFTSARRV
jgi:peptidoglycan DL-endopeptidase CwlO